MTVVTLWVVAVISSSQWNSFDPTNIPIPFIKEGSTLDASLVQIGQIGKGTIPVYSVELSDATSSDRSEYLYDDTVYLVKTSNTAEAVPFDLAFNAVNGHEPDYFLYKYSDADAMQEIANRDAAVFTQRFPNVFAASNQAWLNEENHGNALSVFEQTYSVIFEPTDIASSNRMLFEPDALYAVIVNEPGGAQINLYATPICGDNWKMTVENCDDGNTNDTDGCSASCTQESGFVCTGNPSVCVPQALCGNGIVDAGEQCDQGSNNGTGICTTFCAFDVPNPFGSSSAASSQQSSSSEQVAMSSSFGNIFSSSSSSVSQATIDMNEPAAFMTMTDTIPNFTQNPDNVAVYSGLWSNPLVWSAGHVPVAGENVRIESGVTIQYDIVSDISLDAVGIKGDLVFMTDRNTRLKAGTVQVYREGYLVVGTEQNPVPQGTIAEIIIADRPLDIGTLENPGKDPSQWGTALISFGKVRMHGADKPKTWIRLAQEAFSGQTVLITETPMTNWRPGETIIVPDTRQPPSHTVGGNRGFGETSNPLMAFQTEEHVIDHVSGNQVFLTQPLSFNHKGARNTDGVLEFTPHIGVLDRNIVVRSENPNGTRGHTVFTERSDVDIRFARFVDLGRTDAFQAAHNTVFTNGVLTQIGTNQIGRYAMHFHHLDGPVNPTNTGHQFIFIGNTVDRAKKWNVTVHGTDYGLLSNNVVYDGQGGGFVTEDGTEIENEFTDNFVVKMIGTFVDGKAGTNSNDLARGGNGFWFRRSGNIIKGNVSSDTTYSSYYFSSYFLGGNLALRDFRGATRMETTNRRNPVGVFEDNEAYAMTTYGMWMAFPTGDIDFGTGAELFIIKNSRFWHIANSGVLAYHTMKVVYDGVIMLFDPIANTRKDFGPNGFSLAVSHYENFDTVIQNSRVEGGYYAVRAPHWDKSNVYGDNPTVIKDSIFKNHINIWIASPAGRASSVEIRNVKFGNRIWTPPSCCYNTADLVHRNIKMVQNGTLAILYARSTVRVYDYNQEPGNNFQVYYREQSGGYILPQTDPIYLIDRFADSGGPLASPEAGLTNQQNWDKYRLAMAGKIAPCTNESDPEIVGYTCPIEAPSTLPPEVAFAIPWPNLTLNFAAPVPMYHTVVDNFVPPGADVFFKLDNRAPFTVHSDNDALWSNRFIGGPPLEGPHEIRAWVGDAVTKEPLPGQKIQCVQFAVDLPENGTQTFDLTGLCPENAGN